VAASLLVQVAVPWLDGRGTVIAVVAAKRANQSAKDGQEEEFRDLLAPPPQEIHLRLGPTPNRGRAILLTNLQFLY
jgi:DNA-binding IclR family transcriptional regulator